MRLEGVQLELEVPEVPERHRLVGGAGGEDELRVGVEAQAVHLGKREARKIGNFAQKY